MTKQLSEIFQLALDTRLRNPELEFFNNVSRTRYLCVAIETLSDQGQITRGEELRAKLYVNIELNGEKTFGNYQRNKGVKYETLEDEQRARIEWVKSMIKKLKYDEAPTYSCHN
jgi:hypothetical protein